MTPATFPTCSPCVFPDRPQSTSLKNNAQFNWPEWYLTDEEDMGESGEQTLIIRALVSYLTELARERQWRDYFIGSDQFFAWVPTEPQVRVSPDVYLLDFRPTLPLPPSWQTWLPGHRPPSIAIEIVSSSNWRKDYHDAPSKYAQLGTRELVIFDLEAMLKPIPDRAPLQVLRRVADDRLVPMHIGREPAYSTVLEAWLTILPEGETYRLGIARDPQGFDLIPLTEQVLERERTAKERERTAKERERRAKERERTAKEQEKAARELAEQQLAVALAELEQLKRAR